MNVFSSRVLSRFASRLTITAVLFAFVVAWAGCEPEETEPVPEDPTLEQEETEPLSVADVISEDDRFSELYDALEQADLVETLQGPGPFTLFAPTNDAFDALPEETRDEFYDEEQEERLIEVLSYHAVSGRLSSEDLAEMDSTTTLHGGDLAFTQQNGDMLLNEEASVIEADIEADNGMVHAIDAVLMPPEEGAADPTMD